jgi:hypothetical protein
VPSDAPIARWPQPLPSFFHVVSQVAAERPADLRFSCPQEHAGENNNFMFEVVRRLRQQSNRWGLNWKRGVVGDLSQDIVTYFYGDGPAEGSTQVYIIDIIFNHCGSNPQPAWIDQTLATINAGTVGRWTIRPLP